MSVNSYCQMEMDDDREEVRLFSQAKLLAPPKLILEFNKKTTRKLFIVWQGQEAEALLCLQKEPPPQLGVGPDPSEMSHETALSSDTLQIQQHCQPVPTCTKHHSGSNVSFSHDTEGGEDAQTPVQTATEISNIELFKKINK